MDYFKCGYCTSYLLDLRSKLENKSGIDLSYALEVLSSFAVEIEWQKGPPRVISDEDKHAIAVVENILSRGLPTIPTLQLETAVNSLISSEVQITQGVYGGTITFTDNLKNTKKSDQWQEALLHSYFDLGSIIIDETRFRFPDEAERIKDKYRALYLSSKVSNSKMKSAASTVTLLPYAIARVQKVLCIALKGGALSFEDEQWDIVAVENGTPCVALALKDLMDVLNNLFVLMGRNIKCPKVNLVVYRERIEGKTQYDIVSQAKDINFLSSRSLNSHKHPANLFINSSILENEKDFISTDQIYSHLKAGGVACVLRSVLEAKGERKARAEKPIKYQITTEKQVESLLFFLQFIFRKQQFWPDQLEILKRSLELKPVIALLPTGAGKSLCYQLSVLLQPGLAIVIDPIISLMVDQSENLKRAGIDCHVYINSNLPAERKESISRQIGEGVFQMIFITPERLQSQVFRNQLFNLAKIMPIIYAVIDEAHCISEWGHDFRTSYLNLSKTLRNNCVFEEMEPTFFALTGTASYSVLTDIQREIEIEDSNAIIAPKSFDRPELSFQITRVPTIGKYQQALSVIQDLPVKFSTTSNEFFGANGNETYCGIVFVPHANGAFGNAISTKLSTDLRSPVKFYSGKLDASDKMKIQREYKNNKFPLLVATKAFGMGVDKPNIRYTIHYGIPQSIEGFYQEAGRAGRDKSKAICHIIFSDDNPENANEMLDMTKSSDQINTIHEPAYIEQSDIHRVLWFHRQAFRGIVIEKKLILYLLVKYIYPALETLEMKQKKQVTISFGDRGSTEKGIYRLSTIGLVTDYTLDYVGNVFKVEIIKETDEYYVSRYIEYMSRYKTEEDLNNISANLKTHRGRNIIEKCIGTLVEFTYQEIEIKRRTAILQMADVARNSQTDLDIRSAILTYLESSPFSLRLLDIVKQVKPDDWWKIYSTTFTKDMAQQLLGNCRRVLESFPNHPGIHILMGLSKLRLPSYDDHQSAVMDIKRGLIILKEQYSYSEEAIKQMLLAILEVFRPKVKIVPEPLCNFILGEYPTRQFARYLYNDAQILAETVLINLMLEEVKNIDYKTEKRKNGRQKSEIS